MFRSRVVRFMELLTIFNNDYLITTILVLLLIMIYKLFHSMDNYTYRSNRIFLLRFGYPILFHIRCNDNQTCFVYSGYSNTYWHNISTNSTLY